MRGSALGNRSSSLAVQSQWLLIFGLPAHGATGLPAAPPAAGVGVGGQPGDRAAGPAGPRAAPAHGGGGRRTQTPLPPWPRRGVGGGGRGRGALDLETWETELTGRSPRPWSGAPCRHAPWGWRCGSRSRWAGPAAGRCASRGRRAAPGAPGRSWCSAAGVPSSACRCSPAGTCSSGGDRDGGHVSHWRSCFPFPAMERGPRDTALRSPSPSPDSGSPKGWFSTSEGLLPVLFEIGLMLLQKMHKSREILPAG